MIGTLRRIIPQKKYGVLEYKTSFEDAIDSCLTLKIDLIIFPEKGGYQVIQYKDLLDHLTKNAKELFTHDIKTNEIKYPDDRVLKD